MRTIDPILNVVYLLVLAGSLCCAATIVVHLALEELPPEPSRLEKFRHKLWNFL